MPLWEGIHTKSDRGYFIYLINKNLDTSPSIGSLVIDKVAEILALQKDPYCYIYLSNLIMSMYTSQPSQNGNWNWDFGYVTLISYK